MKILFISHDASRTGAPIVLLNLINWINKNTAKEITILLKDSGDLLEEFQKIAPTFIWNHPRNAFTKFKIINKFFNKFFNTDYDLNQYKILKLIKKKNIDIVYSNTVASHDLAILLKNEIDIPTISHIHEMKYSIELLYSSSLQTNIINSIDKFITVSKLSDSHFKQLTNSNIHTHIINEFIDISMFKKPTINKKEFSKELGLFDNFVVGGCGVASFRKGIDLFIELSRIFQKKHAALPIKFLWVGNVSEEIILGYKYDNEMLGVVENIIFCGVQKEPQNYFNLFDVFALTSREDPFPLVAIEAASLGKPIICFENASGIPELMDGKGGFVVPYMNIDEMMNKIITLYKNKEMYEILSNDIKERSLGYDVNIIAPKINELIDQTLGELTLC
jgi:glycosyltransferase involved in cell wall biosynthesis